MEQFSSDKEKKEKGGAGKAMGMFTAGALAAMGPTPAGDAPNTFDTFSSDHTAVTEGIMFEASKEAQAAVDALMTDFGQNLSVTPEQVGKVKKSVETFVREHPIVQGRTEEHPNGSIDSYSSYSPSLDLQTALNIRTDEMNPLLIGLLWKELNHQMKREAIRNTQQ